MGASMTTMRSISPRDFGRLLLTSASSIEGVTCRTEPRLDGGFYVLIGDAKVFGFRSFVTDCFYVEVTSVGGHLRDSLNLQADPVEVAVARVLSVALRPHFEAVVKRDPEFTRLACGLPDAQSKGGAQ